MKLACADFTFPLLPHDRVLDLIAALEMDGVDVGLFEGRSHLWPSREFADLDNSARTLARTTAQRPVEVIPTELFRFLAGLNVALVVLAAVAAASSVPQVVQVAGITLAVANASQLAQDLRVARLGLIRGPMFRTILVGDAVFTVANVWVALGSV